MPKKENSRLVMIIAGVLLLFLSIANFAFTWNLKKNIVTAEEIKKIIAEENSKNQPQVEKAVEQYLRKLFAGAPTAPEGQKPPAEMPDSDDDAFLGSADAPITIVEFSDYQCPFCKRFHDETLPKLQEKYINTGKVKFVYRDYPLDNHPQAMPAALAAECAGDQNRYFEYHDKIFQNQATINEKNIMAWAAELGLQAATFADCFQSQLHKAEIEKDLADGVKAGIEGTPGFYINNQLVSGAQPFESFETIIEEQLKELQG